MSDGNQNGAEKDMNKGNGQGTAAGRYYEEYSYRSGSYPSRAPEDDETEIDLANMFAHILRKWKLIVALTLVCCAGVGIVGSYQSWQKSQNSYSDQSLSSLTEYMTSAEIQNVRQLYNRYRAMQQKISDYQAYIDHSVLMSMDPNNVAELNVEYAVTSENQNMAQSFNLFSLDYDDYQKMANVMGDDFDPRYMYEIVTITQEQDPTVAQDGDGYSVDVDESNDTSRGTVYRRNNSLFSLSIKTNSEDQCRQIAAIANEAIQNHYQKLLDAGVKLTLTQVDSVYTKQVDQVLADTQQANINKGSDLYAEQSEFETNTINNLSDEEKALYDFYIDKNDKKIERPHRLRYFAIGGLAGLAVGIVFAIIQYLTKSGFHTEDDAARATGLKNIGTIVEEDKNSRGLNRFFLRQARAIENRALPKGTAEEEIRSACARIISICRKSGIDSLYIVKGFSTAYGDETAKSILEKVGGHIADVRMGSPAFSADDLKDLEQMKGAVVLTSLEGSKPYAICENLSACADCGVKVLGNVVIKEN